MKKQFAILLLLVRSIFSYGQETEISPTLPVDPVTNKVTFAKVITAPGISSNDLFTNAQKFIATKSTVTNPYTVTYENKQEGSLIAEGTFTLPAARRKYVVKFSMIIGTKDGKYRYTVTNLIIQFHTDAKSSHGYAGYGGFGGGSTTHKNEETLEYAVEMFYPSRISSRKPVVQFFDEIDEDSFIAIHRELRSLTSSLKQAMTASKDNW